MKIWIDLGNSPHVPLFSALSSELESRGCLIVWTARDYAQTVELAQAASIPAEVIGSHGGKNLISKGLKFTARTVKLARWASGKKIDLLLTHNSHEPLMAAKLMGLTSVTMMDYEHHPANHLSFRLATRVIVPECFPDESITRFGAKGKTQRYEGIKEYIYLSAGVTSHSIRRDLNELGIDETDFLVVVRPHANEALYHRRIENELLGGVLDRLSERPATKVLVLPRKESQEKAIKERHFGRKLVFPGKALEGPALLARADLVISGGGTMNREAAALGTPVMTIFAGPPAAVDLDLAEKGRMFIVRSLEEFEGLLSELPGRIVPPAPDSAIRSKVADMIISAAETGI